MNRPPKITRRKYTLNKFEVRPYSKTITMFDLYYLKQKIGWFSIVSDIITTSNSGKNQYIFLKSDVNQVIGTILFTFNDKIDKWKIGYVKLKIVPEKILSIRTVLFEKVIGLTVPEEF